MLLKKLQSAITTKRHKSQNAILQSIETEYGVGSGLSKSTTDKIMKKANGIYKSLITNKMQWFNIAMQFYVHCMKWIKKQQDKYCTYQPLPWTDRGIV